MAPAISVEHLSKSYRLGGISSGTLVEDVRQWWATLTRRDHLAPNLSPDSRFANGMFRALQDVSFEVEEGTVLGVIGRNGAGKSTLLKILSQVTAPTAGRVTLHGRVASLLEVGTGFHPDLSGRDNVFLNGAIMGMTKSEIRRRFDEIVAFSECEKFIDTPVKRYSSGMYVRLAFAVAAHLEPEILIVDEVLAVGDAQFQRKCIGKMGDVARHGRTILFVSHSMVAISALCRRAILLRDGRVAADGPVADAVSAYQAAYGGSRTAPVDIALAPRQGTGKGRFKSLAIRAVNSQGKTMEVAVPGSDMYFKTDIDCFTDFSGANVAVVIYDANGWRVVDANTALHGEFLSMRAGERASIKFHLRDLLLKPGDYSISLALLRGGIEGIDEIEQAGTWMVEDDIQDVKHTETFPGIYQCRFSHSIRVTSDAGVPL